MKLKSEYSKNIVSLLSGNALAQAIPIAISPILTRVYTPQDFGVVALFGSITMLLGSIINAQYESAIVLPKKHDDAYSIASLSLFIAIVFSLFLFIIVLLFHDFIVEILGSKEISIWLYFIPPVVFLIGLFNVLNYLNIRQKNFNDVSKVKVFKAIGTGTIQIIVGIFKSGAFGLIIGQIFSHFIGNFYLLKRTNIQKYKLFTIKNLAIAKKYKNFPIYYLPNNLIFNLSNTVVTILISSVFGAVSLGLYSMANKILGIPGAIVGMAVSQVYLQKGSEEIKVKGTILPIFKETFKKLLFISFPLYVVFFFTLEEIFSFIFGKEWAIAGYYAEILAPLFFLRFIRAGLNTTIVILEKQKLELWINSLMTICLLITFLVAFILQMDTEQFLILFSGAISMINIFIIYIYFDIAKKENKFV